MKLYYAYDLSYSLARNFYSTNDKYKKHHIVNAGFMPIDPLVIHSDLVQELLK